MGRLSDDKSRQLEIEPYILGSSIGDRHLPATPPLGTPYSLRPPTLKILAAGQNPQKRITWYVCSSLGQTDIRDGRATLRRENFHLGSRGSARYSCFHSRYASLQWRWQEPPRLLPPCIPQKRRGIVLLLPPAISEWIECWSARAPEECGSLNYLFQMEHCVPPQKLKEVMNGGDVNVVENQQSPGLQVRIEIIILKIWKWIAVWAVNNNYLQFFSETVLWQCDLSRTLHESDHIRTQ